MEFKIIFTNDKNIRMEAICKDENERKDAVKMIKLTLADLDSKEVEKSVEIYSKKKSDNNEKKTDNNEKTIQPSPSGDEPASEGQKRYMDKLGIEYNEMTSKYEAIDLINNYKRAHNIPITGKGSN